VRVSNRWPIWTWNTSPARTASSAALTAGWYCPAGVRETCSAGGTGRVTATLGAAGVARSLVIASSRASASSYAASRASVGASGGTSALATSSTLAS
jgi:hypothetical protein